MQFPASRTLAGGERRQACEQTLMKIVIANLERNTRIIDQYFIEYWPACVWQIIAVRRKSIDRFYYYQSSTSFLQNREALLTAKDGQPCKAAEDLE